MNFKLTIAGITTIHKAGVFGDGNALCGQDLSGDSGYEEAEQTLGKITCEQCAGVINYCKNIPKNQISDNLVKRLTFIR